MALIPIYMTCIPAPVPLFSNTSPTIGFKKMFFSKALLVACSAIAAIAAPTDAVKRDAVKRDTDALSKRATGSSTGTSGGFYYSYWTDG